MMSLLWVLPYLSIFLVTMCVVARTTGPWGVLKGLLVAAFLLLVWWWEFRPGERGRDLPAVWFAATEVAV